MRLVRSERGKNLVMFAGGPEPCRILIADDVADIRRLVRTWIQTGDDNFEVVGEASDGVEAVALTRAEKPNAVILDLSMPRMDGLETIREIRKFSPETKILVFSGFESGALSGAVLALGADAYLEKGSDLSQITSALRDLCLG